MKLIDADDLKVHISELMLVYSGTELNNAILNAIDNAEPAEAYSFKRVQELVKLSQQFAQEIENLKRSKDECKSCIHRDPEDKKCDCGRQERQGCLFPVSDDYFCKYYERGT